MGLSVGLIQSTMPEDQRKEAYSADVTYATNQELGFDYLRDHLTVTKDGKHAPNIELCRILMGPMLYVCHVRYLLLRL